MVRRAIFIYTIFALVFLLRAAHAEKIAEKTESGKKPVSGVVQFASSDNSFIFINLGNAEVQIGDVIEVYKGSVPVATYRIKRVFEDMSEGSLLNKPEDVFVNTGDMVRSFGLRKDASGTHETEPVVYKPAAPALSEQESSFSPEEKEKILSEIDSFKQQTRSLEKGESSDTPHNVILVKPKRRNANAAIADTGEKTD